MKLEHESRLIECPDVSALAWDESCLVEVMTGRRIGLDGTMSARAFFLGYPFDRGLCIRGRDAFWTLAYDNRGTKAVLYKNWKEHRELNRSYYFAKQFDYPVALTVVNQDRVVIIHCPNSYDTIVVEDADTGEVLGTKKSKGMEFHSRLSVSGDGRFLVSAGWFWHPLGGAWLCSVGEILGSDHCPVKEVEFSFGAEIDAAAFLGNDHLVVCSTEEVVSDEPGASELRPLQLGLWSISDARWISTAPLQESAGTIMPWKEWLISFNGHPKAIELATGKVVHVWSQIESGHQIGCIELGTPSPPTMALNARAGMFAVCDSKGITVVSLRASE
jgi:hypothetical protein